MKKVLAAATLLVLAISGAAVAGPSTTVKVTGGAVQGVLQADLAVFKGIPFAAPPLGDLRWRSPQAPAAWSGIKVTAAPMAPCLQAMSFLVPKEGPKPSEDCLYLNVWAPAQKPARPLPVMVWIHGGAFTTGAPTADMFDGAALARRGVILVSVAYRLGVQGFLADPELSKESGHGSGNYGIEDQVAALKWVRANIAAFGGDTTRVTIFGQSAGAASVSILAASPLAKGLFQRAIAQSGASFAGPGRGMVSSLSSAEARGKGALGDAGAATIAEARKLTAEQLLKMKGQFGPNQDGYVIADDPRALYLAHRQNDTPIMVGSNSDEGGGQGGGRPTTPEAFEAQIKATYGAAAPTILAAYPHATADEARVATKNQFRDSGLAWNDWTWARLQSKTGKGRVYAYYFDQVAPKNSIFYSPDGTVHTGEVPYVFGTFGAPQPASYTDDDKALSDLVMTYWTNFAKTGDPNAKGVPTWPAFTDANQTTLRFNGRSGPVETPNLTQLRAIDAAMGAPAVGR